MADTLGALPLIKVSLWQMSLAAAAWCPSSASSRNEDMMLQICSTWAGQRICCVSMGTAVSHSVPHGISHNRTVLYSDSSGSEA